ncbi:tail fiber domain-containing protein [Candidatus Wolfebacteria bacterium]|nr:tail fiber domain-containing protein [Candidatus Wolfebacteria bacterium]
MKILSKIFKSLNFITAQIIIAIILFSGISIVSAAWSEPTSAPTGGNVAEPLNTSSNIQSIIGNTKLIGGNIGLFDLTASGNGIFSGKVGIGSANIPTSALEVVGNVKIISPQGGLNNSLMFGSGLFDNYGTWAEDFSSTNDNCNNSKTSEYTCLSTENKTCTDIITITDKYSVIHYNSRNITCVSPDEPLYSIKNIGGILSAVNNSGVTTFSVNQIGALIGDGSGLNGVVKTADLANYLTKTGDGSGLTGVVKTAGDSTITGSLTITGAATANSWNTSSDLRLKKDIIPLENILPKLANINAVGFNWIEKNKDDKHQIGFIAQEVEKEFPELVSTDGNGYESMDYGKMSAVLLEAIKELKAENDSLKTRIEKLENK